MFSLSDILSFSFIFHLGKDANPQERKAAMKTAEEFLKQMNYSSNTQVSVCGNELARKKKKLKMWELILSSQNLCENLDQSTLCVEVILPLCVCHPVSHVPRTIVLWRMEFCRNWRSDLPWGCIMKKDPICFLHGVSVEMINHSWMH